jgi:hypothetical protein
MMGHWLQTIWANTPTDQLIWLGLLLVLLRPCKLKLKGEEAVGVLPCIFLCFRHWMKRF